VNLDYLKNVVLQVIPSSPPRYFCGVFGLILLGTVRSFVVSIQRTRTVFPGPRAGYAAAVLLGGASSSAGGDALAAMEQSGEGGEAHASLTEVSHR